MHRISAFLVLALLLIPFPAFSAGIPRGGGGKSAAVTGGSSSTNNAIPCFDGTTGKIIKECTTDMVAVQNLDMNGNLIVNSAGSGNLELGTSVSLDLVLGEAVGDLTNNDMIVFANEVSIRTNNTVRAVAGDTGFNINNGELRVLNGNGFIIGHTAQLTVLDLAEFQMLGTAAVDSSMLLGRFSADAVGPDFRFFKGRGATIGTLGIVSDNDIIGQISYFPDDGVDFDTLAARFYVEVDDSAPVAGDIGMAFVWEQMSGLGVALRETMRLVNDGELRLANLKFDNNGNQANILTIGNEASIFLAVNNTTGRMTLSPVSTFGLDIQTVGSKVTCDLDNDGSLFYENTAADSTAGLLFMCMEAAADTFSYIQIVTGG